MLELGLLGSARVALATIARVGLIISILLLFAITLLVSGQVLMRNVFSIGLPWADELARWFGITLIYFSIPHLLMRGQHIAVTLLPDRLTGHWRTAVLVFAELSVAVFAILSLVAFQAFLEKAARFTTAAMGMPNIIFYMPPLIGIALLAAIAILRTLTILRDGETT